MTLRNRFAMAPMSRRKTPGGIPTTESADYYSARAAGGTGLIITEGTFIDDPAAGFSDLIPTLRSEEHTSELQSLMRISYAVLCLKKKKHKKHKSHKN